MPSQFHYTRSIKDESINLFAVFVFIRVKSLFSIVHININSSFVSAKGNFIKKSVPISTSKLVMSKKAGSNCKTLKILVFASV